MFEFSETVCTDSDAVCTWVETQTGSETTARVADFLIGLPLSLLGLLILGLVIRWVLHRLVDRIVKRAETGMIPSRVSRLSLGSLGPGKMRSPQEMATTTRRVWRAEHDQPRRQAHRIRRSG